MSLRVLWCGELLDSDGYGTPVRAVLDDGEVHTERRELCSCRSAKRWVRDARPNSGTLAKALTVTVGRKVKR